MFRCGQNQCSQMFETWFAIYQHTYRYHKIRLSAVDANLYMINPDLAKKPTAKRRGRGRKPKSTVPIDSGNNTSSRSIGLLPLSSNGSLPHNLNASFRLPDEVLNFASSRKEPVRNMNELDRNSKKRRDNEDDHAFCRPEQMSEAEDLVDEAANDVRTKGAEAETCEIRKRTESRNSNEDPRKQLKKFRRAAHLPTPISSPGNIEKINICAFCHFEYGEKDDPLLDEPCRASSSYFFLFFPIFLSILLFFLFFSNFLLFFLFFSHFTFSDPLDSQTLIFFTHNIYFLVN